MLGTLVPVLWSVLGCVRDRPMTEAEAEYLSVVRDRTNAMSGCVLALSDLQDEATLFGPDEDGRDAFQTWVGTALSDLTQLVDVFRPRAFDEPPERDLDVDAYYHHGGGEPYLAVRADHLHRRTLRTEVLAHEAGHVQGDSHSRAMSQASKSFAAEGNQAYTPAYVADVIQLRDPIILMDLQYWTFQTLMGRPDERARNLLTELDEWYDPDTVLTAADVALTGWTREDWVRARIELDVEPEQLEFQTVFGADLDAIEAAAVDSRCHVFEQVQTEFNAVLEEYADANGLVR